MISPIFGLGRSVRLHSFKNVLLLTGALIGSTLCEAAPIPKNNSPVTFETATIEVPYKRGQSSTSVEVKYSNRSATLVEILDIRTNCSCTSARIDKKQLKPGEGGVLTAEIDLTGRKGEFVAVATLDVKSGAIQDPITLTIHVKDQIAPIDLSHGGRMMRWKMGEKLSKKTTQVSISVSGHYDVTAISSTPDFDIEVAPTDRRDVFVIKAAPKDTGTAKSAVITVQVSHGNKDVDKETLYAIVY